MSKQDNRFKSRKFLFSVFFAVVGAAALFTGNLGGAEFVALASFLTGLYAAGNVADTMAERAGK